LRDRVYVGQYFQFHRILCQFVVLTQSKTSDLRLPQEIGVWFARLA
jgi:hypothetical protein